MDCDLPMDIYFHLMVSSACAFLLFCFSVCVVDYSCTGVVLYFFKFFFFVGSYTFEEFFECNCHIAIDWT
jgi:hypothetical protein